MTIVTADGEEAVALQSKDAVAAAILDAAERLLRRARGGCAGRPLTAPRAAMAHDPLRDHLEYFKELGVEGVHPDALWRSRAEPSVHEG